jgi:hypothetical protein
MDVLAPFFTASGLLKSDRRAIDDETTSTHVRTRGFTVTGSGGASRDRTDDPLLAKQVLSQLSYGPLYSAFLCLTLLPLASAAHVALLHCAARRRGA